LNPKITAKTIDFKVAEHELQNIMKQYSPLPEMHELGVGDYGTPLIVVS
jgi:hypothetical protein